MELRLGVAQNWKRTLAQMTTTLCATAFIAVRDIQEDLVVLVSEGQCQDVTEALKHLSRIEEVHIENTCLIGNPIQIGTTQAFAISLSKQRPSAFLCLDSVCGSSLSEAQWVLLENFLVRVRHDLIEIDACRNHDLVNEHLYHNRQQSQPSLQSFIDSLEGYVWVKNLEGNYISANEKTRRHWNTSPIGKNAFDLFPKEKATAYSDIDKEVLRTRNQIVTDEYANWKGDTGWIEIVKAPLLSDTGDLIGVIGMTRDITQRKAFEEQIRIATAAFSNSYDAFVVTDEEGNIVEVNQAFSSITGFTRNEVLGLNPRCLKSGRHSQEFYQSMWHNLSSEGRWQGEIWNRRKDGTIYPQLSTINAIFDENGRVRYYIAVFIDISQQKKAESRLAQLAYHDSLTGLKNRASILALMDRTLTRVTTHGEAGAVLFIDIDHFKLINDTRGHTIGDEVLIEVSQRLKKSIRADDVASRLGGDEFLVLVSDTQCSATVTEIVIRIMASLSRPIIVSDGTQLRLSSSIGVAQYPRHGTESVTLLRNADAAMFHAKNSGRNGFTFYNESMLKEFQKEVRIREEVPHAILNNEFHLVYQPKVDLATSKLIGVEALIRWQHPNLGPIPPSEFIPIIEKSGYIEEVGLWVIEEACKQGKKWLDNGFDVGRISVNVSGRQILGGSLAYDVKRLISSTGFKPSLLEVEVTESWLVQNLESSSNQLEQLRDMGILIAIDDFGTGYSSLSYLANLPASTLKIDRSFTQNIAINTKNQLIAEAIISLGDSFGMDVIAEGVEDRQQAEILTGFGCKQAQGFLFGRPMPPSELVEKYYCL
ncbi:EAL domain-containing protein [Ferrimonas sp.]|uniref:sensor domain-containing protein n=1 Tax=Ferrimonas sp. TaxID=2080861 RepID=UPI003A955664